MNPAILIPTYWSRDPQEERDYDHTTSVTDPHPSLERLLASLDGTQGIARTIILLAAERDVEKEARAQVDAIVSKHPALNPLVIGVPEARLIQNHVLAAAPRLTGECVSLRGYGAIRNLGLITAAIFGHAQVIFLDDDEVVEDPEFLPKAMYGLGQLTRQNLPILAKSGFFFDANNSYFAPDSVPFYDKAWSQAKAFNDWMRQAQMSARISRSNYLCGGLMALHYEAYTRVPFDPFIARGEDQDYLFNLKMQNIIVWFDNRWSIKHLPPETTDDSERFKQNVYRWVYEKEKLKRMSARLDFHQVTAASLLPYPGSMLEDNLRARVKKTAWLRALGRHNKASYISFARRGYEDALINAKAQSSSYLSFQTWWPHIASTLWNTADLARELTQSQAEKPTSNLPDKKAR